MKTPVIFFIFNRPQTTKLVFDQIRKYKPEMMIVVADGPRKNNPADVANCLETRKIVDKIDWPCKVIKEYSATNLGCKKRISSGLDYTFSIVDRAIILEDDSLPNDSFFSFCEELVERYKDDKRIMSIAGSNFLFDRSEVIDKDSYYFSRYPYIWGWATWKRAWDLYEIKMTNWPYIKKLNIVEKKWTKKFDIAYNDKIDTWDIQWVYTCFMQNGLTIVPHVNLVSNIGFGQGSTHTRIKTIVADMETINIKFPLKHPTTVIPNHRADKISHSHFTRVGLIIDHIKYLLNSHKNSKKLDQSEG